MTSTSKRAVWLHVAKWLTIAERSLRRDGNRPSRRRRARLTPRRLGLESLEQRLALSGLSGYVYVDANNDGVRGEAETGVPGVLITLSGSASSGTQVSRTALTADDGAYAFSDLSAGTYQLVESQPAAMLDGVDATAVSTAVAEDDQITGIAFAAGDNLSENNFGEIGLRPQYITIAWFLASAPSVATMLREYVALGEAAAGNASLAAAIRAGADSFSDDTESTDTTEDTNASPVAVADAYTVIEDVPLSVLAASGVLANDTDADGDTLTAALVSQPAHGTLVLGADGSLTYTPTANYNGTDTFTYQASDGTASSGTATVSLTVSAVNDAPAATADSYSVNQDTTLTVTAIDGLLTNDTDAESDSLTAQLASAPSHGTATVNADGSFTYTPFATYSGTDSFTYQAGDGTSLSVAATVTVVVNYVNAAPVGSADAYTATEDQTLTVTAATGVLANDTDANGDSLTATLSVAPAHGTLTLGADGSFVYTPNTNFYGTDTFRYVASDGAAASSASVASITVSSVNDAPVAADDSYTVNQNAELAVDALLGVLANDSDPEGNTLAVLPAAAPANGHVTLNADGSFTYTPAAGFSGTDTFTYQVTDGLGGTDVGAVTVEVAAVPPVAIALPTEFTNPAAVAQRTVGQSIAFTVTVETESTLSHTFQLDLEDSGIPAGQTQPTIDAGTGQFLWTPSATGRFEIRVIVVREDGEADQETFLIDIVPDSCQACQPV